MKRSICLLIFALFSTSCTPSAKHPRSQSAIGKFKKTNPCPANQQPKGPCPGYIIDHITPLACNGQDIPLNMQWQTIEQAKAKDKWERKTCHSHKLTR